jgi:hypothetical protein
MSNWKTRIPLLVLDSVLAVSAIVSAFTVIPLLPREWIAGSIFPDYTAPAVALGVLVGGSALIAAVAVIFRPLLGAAAAMVSAVMIIGFELVEIAAVGFSPVTYGVDKPQSWLQVAYLVLGAVIAVLGARLWRALSGGRASEPLARRGNRPAVSRLS